MSQDAASNDPAVRWGLPPGFQPVVSPLPNEVKDVLRGMLRPNEPIIASLGNEGDTIFIVASTQRVFSVRRGATAGVTGFTIRPYEWNEITDMKMQTASLNVRIVLSYHSRDGRTPESGPRAKQWKLHTDSLAPFETARGSQVYEAIQSIWIHKTHEAS